MSFARPFPEGNVPVVWAHNCGVMYGNVLLTSVGLACQHCGLIQNDCKPKESNVPQVKITDEMVEAALGKAKERQAETLTVRDQFAMSYLSGSLANPDTSRFQFHHIAANAYAMADAMLQERNK